MPHPTVLVEMRMWFAGRVLGAMRVAVVYVMHVRMRMGHWLVNVHVFMMFGEV